MIVKKNSLLIILFCMLGCSIVGQSFSYVSNNFCFDNFIPVNTTPQMQTKNLLVTDLNNDSTKEVIVTKGSFISVYSFSNSTGSFNLLNTFTVNFGTSSGLSKQCIGYGKFNNDNKPDLIFASDSSVYIYANSGGFNFFLLKKINFPIAYVGHEHYLKVADFNNDTGDDFFFISEKSGNGIDVLCYRQYSVSAFSLDNTYNIIKSYTNVGSGILDINLGNLDTSSSPTVDAMFTMSTIKDSVFFLQNVSTSSLALMVPVGVRVNAFNGSSPENSEISDLDGDGKADFIFYLGTALTNSICVVQGTNSLNLNGFNVLFSTNGFKVKDFKINDITNDGKPDFVAIGTYTTILGGTYLGIYSGTGITTYIDTLATLFTPISTATINADEMILADIDRNTTNDIIFKPRGISDKTQLLPNFTFFVDALPTTANVCSNVSAILTVTSSAPSGNYNWYFSTGSSAVSTGTAYTTFTSGDYYSKLNFPMFSGVSCSLLSDTVNVIDISPTISLSPSSNTTLCSGQNFSVFAMGANTYTWFNASNSVLVNNSVLSQQAFSDYTYHVIGQTTNGCRDSINFEVNLYPLDSHSIIPSTNGLICLGDSVTLSLPSAQSYTWSNNSNSSSITVHPNTYSTYTLTYTDMHTCISTKTIDINIDFNCIRDSTSIIFNSVTPNNDGINDVFYISNIEKYPNNHVSIFNRWGKEIFNKDNYNNTKNFWPTREERNNLIPSTYFFIIDYGNGIVKKGWLELFIN